MKKLLVIFLCFVITSNACEKAIDPKRITSAGGSITEIIYFLNFQKNLVAVDVTSNYPPEARDLPSIGYVRQLSAEGVLSLDPTIIIGEDDMGPPSVMEQIKRTNVEIKIIPENHTVEGILEKVKCVSKIIGADSDELIDTYLNPKIQKLEQQTDLEDKKKLFISLACKVDRL